MAIDTSVEKWTITGVSPAIRKVARAAARRDNMTLGEWIERAVERAAEARHERPLHRAIQNHRPDRRYF